MNNTPQRNPYLWETVVMAGSFALLWAWFLARQSVVRTPGAVLSPIWTILQVAAIGALVFILIRRMIRVRDALRENAKLPNQPPFGQPPFGSMNGSSHKNGSSPSTNKRKK